MTQDRGFQLGQAAVNLICAVLIWRYTFPLDGTEFSGGRVTGPLLDMSGISIVLFLIGLTLSFVSSRLPAAITLVASVLALPIYIYFALPGPFRRVFKGLYSVPLTANIVLNRDSIVGLITLMLAVAFSIYRLSIPGAAKQNRD